MPVLIIICTGIFQSGCSLCKGGKDRYRDARYRSTLASLDDNARTPRSDDCTRRCALICWPRRLCSTVPASPLIRADIACCTDLTNHTCSQCDCTCSSGQCRLDDVPRERDSYRLYRQYT